ncbi:bifunctional hydroxymethylpyrimidine kinase/phosphomethylpyrimidine kinase [Weissella minor]|uniref:pyridoxal kinase n=1 Tax=Weissella minor TaxID=1620 RepID=A0A0R2JPJ0_9LACO|nr:bifunctional hydroxymethylpyrimidine kinase/phosphomethylpyrimidine kinase [Weissella minor]KRN76780.1 hydroxymethylpyrimidine phosphomethylpyrimidine kinase [Weissella minor]
MNVKKIVTIAGSDSLAGGGIQADLATFSEYQFQGLSAITSIVTVIDDDFQINVIDSNILSDQLDSIFALDNIAAIKVGLLSTKNQVTVVANFLEQFKNIVPIVIDPVMVFKETNNVDTKELLAAIQTKLLPMATIVTPNLEEASLLSGMEIHNQDDLTVAAKKIKQFGAKAVLAKGGARLSGATTFDVLIDENAQGHALEHERLATNTNNGAGCTLSSAIACELGRQVSMRDAVESAQMFVLAAIKDGVQLNQKFKVGNVWQGAQRAVYGEKCNEK